MQLNQYKMAQQNKKVAYPHEKVLYFVKDRKPYFGQKLGDNILHIKKLTMIVFMKITQDGGKRQDWEEPLSPPLRIELKLNV